MWITRCGTLPPCHNTHMNTVTRALAALATTLLFIPVAASAQSADIQAQAQALLVQVQALQAQLAQAQAQAGTSGSANTTQGVSGLAQQAGVQVIDSSACPQIGRTLKVGSTGDDVSRLQQFLARDKSIYPEGTVSGYYGALTQVAVQRWQAKFNIVSSGTPDTTGYGVVGPRTAAAISLQCSLYGGGSGAGGSGTVGGYIQVSPISGNAPLQVNVQATVNTTNSCAGATYTLSWGDSSAPVPIPVAQGNCNQLSQTYTHTYTYGGTYQVVLSAGSHHSTAVVTVFGPSAPYGGGVSYGGGSIIPSGPTQQTTGLPAETFVASVTSGNAPLAVTFTGIVTSADAGWCANGCSDTLVFGDGSTASVPLPTSQNTYQNYSIAHTYSAPGTYTATLYQGQQSGNRPVGTVTITVAGTPATYGAFSVTPSGSNPLTVSVSFGLPSSCTGYQLSWGDSSANVSQTDGGSSCAQTSSTQNFSHTYPSAGSYSITLKRGPSLSVTDTATVSISN